MADRDVKPEGAPEETEARSSEKKVYDIKGGVKDKARAILLTAVLLAVTILAATAGLLTNLNGDSTASYALPVFTGGVALLCWFGFTLLAVVKRDRTLSKIIAVIFGVSFVGFFALMLSGVGGTGTDPTALIFGALSLPYFAIYTLFEALGMSSGGVIFTGAIIYVAVIALNVWNFVRLRAPRGQGRPDGEKRGFSLRMFEDGGRREDKKDRW